MGVNKFAAVHHAPGFTPSTHSQVEFLDRAARPTPALLEHRLRCAQRRYCASAASCSIAAFRRRGCAHASTWAPAALHLSRSRVQGILLHIHQHQFMPRQA